MARACKGPCLVVSSRSRPNVPNCWFGSTCKGRTFLFNPQEQGGLRARRSKNARAQIPRHLVAASSHREAESPQCAHQLTTPILFDERHGPSSRSARSHQHLRVAGWSVTNKTLRPSSYSTFPPCLFPRLLDFLAHKFDWSDSHAHTGHHAWVGLQCLHPDCTLLADQQQHCQCPHVRTRCQY